MESQAKQELLLKDDSILRYRVEGNASHSSPILLFINDALTPLEIWVPTISLLQETHPQYRLLRYDMRGYSDDSLGTTSNSITLNLLASDLNTLLQTLCISHVHCIIGLGFGAHVGLKFLTDHPSIASAFVGIGFGFSVPRQQAIDEWALRCDLPRRVDKGMGITGDKAVARWFTADARDGDEWVRVRDLVAGGSIEGMEKLSGAVLESLGHGDTAVGKDYMGKDSLVGLQVPAPFICGAEDHMFPEEMEGFPAMMRNATGRFMVINKASRVVCCERPKEFVGYLMQWLSGLVA